MRDKPTHKLIDDHDASHDYDTDHPGWADGHSPSTQHLIRKLRKSVNQITNPTQEDA